MGTIERDSGCFVIKPDVSVRQFGTIEGNFESVKQFDFIHLLQRPT